MGGVKYRTSKQAVGMVTGDRISFFFVLNIKNNILGEY